MRMPFVVAALGAALALAPADPAEAKLYKWVDADGNVTYSQRKPPDLEAEAEEIEVRSRSVTNEQAREQLDVLQGAAEAREKERGFEQSHATATREREKRLAKNCEIARENLRILQTNARVKTQDDQGREVFLGEEELNARTARAEANIDKYCE